MNFPYKKTNIKFATFVQERRKARKHIYIYLQKYAEMVNSKQQCLLPIINFGIVEIEGQQKNIQIGST